MSNDAGMDIAGMTTELDLCAEQWELDQDERDRAYEDGMPGYVLEGVEHSCCLTLEHDGTHVCECGASS